MQRAIVTLLAALTIAVATVGIVVWQAEQRRARDHDELLCLERLHVTAAVAVMVPESELDIERRVEAVRALGDQIERC